MTLQEFLGTNRLLSLHTSRTHRKPSLQHFSVATGNLSPSIGSENITDQKQTHASKNISIDACVFDAAVTFSPNRFLTINRGATYRETETVSRGLCSA
jgi:hypothetical protein